MILPKSQESVVLVRVATVGVIMSPVAVEQSESYPQSTCVTLVQPEKDAAAGVSIKIGNRNRMCCMSMANIIHYSSQLCSGLLVTGTRELLGVKSGLFESQGAKLLVSLENEDAPDEVDSLTIPIAFVVGAVALNVARPLVPRSRFLV